MTTVDKYIPQQGGLTTLWNKANNAVGDFLTNVSTTPKKLGEWGDILMIGGIIAVGGFVILIAISFANGKQDLSKLASAVRP